MSNINEYVASLMLDSLEDYEGHEIYNGDLGFTLLENANWDGTITYSRVAAIEWLNEYWDDVGEIVGHMVDAGYDADALLDLWSNPERFMAMVVLFYSRYIEPYISDDKYILDEENIKNIREQLEDIKTFEGINI